MAAMRLFLFLIVLAFAPVGLVLNSEGACAGLSGRLQPGTAIAAPSGGDGQAPYRRIENDPTPADAHKLSRIEDAIRMSGSTKSKRGSTKAEVDCSVVKWNAVPSAPGLEIVCPPREVFAPVRIYLKMGWVRVGRATKYLTQIVAPVQSSTKMQAGKQGLRFRLQVCKDGGTSDCKAKWIDFDEISAFHLEGE